MRLKEEGSDFPCNPSFICSFAHSLRHARVLSLDACDWPSTLRALWCRCTSYRATPLPDRARGHISCEVIALHIGTVWSALPTSKIVSNDSITLSGEAG